MTQFTVVKQGQEIEFDSAFSDVAIAKYYVEENLSWNNFAMNLAEAKKPSAKQIAWIHFLATEHLKKELEVENQTTDEQVKVYKNIIEKMYSKVKSNSRQFVLNLPAGFTFKTVNKGPNVGCVYVFENDTYLGKITKEGYLYLKQDNEDVKAFLEDAEDNLLQLAKIYGHETGRCAVCRRTLSDPLSVQMGIGPICAKRFE